VSVVPRNVYEPLPADWREQLAALWPDAERLAWAFRLANDVDTCADLIAGRAVSSSRLDESALLEARRRSLVQLRPPLELLNVREAA
jgi:hypothetical protein